MKGTYSLQAGFTLIELMLVMVIILILSGGSITAYLTFNKNQTVSNDARALAAEIYRIRTLAATMQYPVGCNGLVGYNLKSTAVSSELTGVTVTAKCAADIAEPTKTILLNSVFTVPLDVTFNPGSGYSSIGADTTILLTHKTDVSVTKTVTIGAYGVVSGI